MCLALGLTAYFYSSFKKSISGPVIEVLANAMPLFGFVFTIFMAVHVNEFIWVLGDITVGLLILLQLAENHKKFMVQNKSTAFEPSNFFEQIAWKILTLNPFIKAPILLVLCVPILTILTSLLLLLGQKPDSLVRAFTDTYKYGFSHYLLKIIIKIHIEVSPPGPISSKTKTSTIS